MAEWGWMTTTFFFLLSCPVNIRHHWRLEESLHCGPKWALWQSLLQRDGGLRSDFNLGHQRHQVQPKSQCSFMNTILKHYSFQLLLCLCCFHRVYQTHCSFFLPSIFGFHSFYYTLKIYAKLCYRGKQTFSQCSNTCFLVLIENKSPVDVWL